MNFVVIAYQPEKNSSILMDWSGCEGVLLNFRLMFQIDLRGIRLRCNTICWLLDKTFIDSEMRISLDGAPCLYPFAGIQWSSLNKDMLDCLGGQYDIKFYYHGTNSGKYSVCGGH